MGKGYEISSNPLNDLTGFFPTSKILDFQIKIHFNPNTAQEPTELKSKPGFFGSASLTMKAFPRAGNV